MKQLYFVMLSLSITLVSGLFLVYSNALDLLSSQSEPKRILVYAKSSPELTATSDLIQFLQKDLRVENFSIQSKSEILNSFNTSFPEYSQGLSFSEDVLSVIPQIVEVSFKSGQDARGLADALKTVANVTEVQAHFHWLEKLSTLKSISLNFLVLLFGFFAFVLVTISVLMAHKFVLNEKDRLQVYSFCGATQKQIFKILFSKFYIVSLLGIGTGIGLSYIFYIFLVSKISIIDVDRLVVDRVRFLNGSEISILVGAFVLVVYATITISAKSALKEVWNED